MADKGFLIQDLLQPKKATLTIPPFLSRTRSLQFTSKEVTETQQIARLRIHVERAIRRIKEYQIFDSLATFVGWFSKPNLDHLLSSYKL